MISENRKYYYKTSAWNSLYRYDGKNTPEEYNHKTYKWEETEDAVAAFFNPSTSDYSSLFPMTFASKYYELFTNPKTTEAEVQDPIFSEFCFALGFDYSFEWFESIKGKYHCEYIRTEDIEKDRELISRINDVYDLGKSIHYIWRDITHWDYDGKLLEEDNRLWFIEAFGRLVELLDGKAKQQKNVLLGMFDYATSKQHNNKMINYGIVDGNNTVVLIKTGIGGSVLGYQNKYIKLAHQIKKEYGYSVVVADNPYDGTDSLGDAISVIKEHFKNDIVIYYMGISMGATMGAWFGEKYPQIKRMLLINGPLNCNIDKTINELEGLECDRVTLVYGSLDPSYGYAKSLEFNKEINVVIKEGMDHNFSQSMNEFMDLPFKYLL